MNEYVRKRCGACSDHESLTKRPRVFRNGTQHMEALCPHCGAHLQFISSDTDPVFQFGKYKGRRVKEIMDADPGYCRWLRDKEVKLSGAVRDLLRD